MKNKYDIRGDDVVVFLKRRSGEIIETVVELKSLGKLESYTGTFAAMWSKTTNSYYVSGNMPCGGGRFKCFKLHRYLLDFPTGLEVDHKDHDTLNNRLSNLKSVSKSLNQQNRLGSNVSNLSSGVRGVTYNARNKKWFAHARVNNKRINLGYFETVAEAETVVIDFRSKEMKNSMEYLEVVR